MPIAGFILEFIAGPDRGRIARISTFGPTLLGRGADVDIRLPAVDSSLSRHQAHIELSPDACVLRKVDGSNSVVEVNDEGVDSSRGLADGDVVRLGSTLFRVGLVLLNSGCLVCGQGVEDELPIEPDNHAEISTRAHECCVDNLGLDGEHISSYERCHRLDDGALERVYQVYERSTRRIWALRQFLNARWSTTFESEVQLLVALRHPHILRCIHGAVDNSGAPFFVTEFARDGNVAGFMGRGGHQQNTALQLIDDVLEGLKFIHGTGRTHGNVHPGSIVVQGEARGWGTRPRAKLVDIGTTNGRRLHIPSPTTLKWYPPEQGFGPHEQRDDLFAVAAVLHSLLVQRRPNNPPLAADRSAIAPKIAAVINRACHREPGRRFRSAQQLQDALREVSARW